MDFKFWNELDKKMKRLFMEMGVLVGTLLVLIVLICLVWNGREEKPADTNPPAETTTTPVETTEPKDTSPEGILADYMAEHGLTDADYTADMMEVYKYFPEVRDFILAIPLEAGRDSVDDISMEDRTNGVPLFLQWDNRWGYKMYGDSVLGMSGCGPTCLSMVAYYLTGDATYSPVYMADFAVKNGYRTESGSTWGLFSEGPFLLGLESKEVPLHEGSIAKYVKNGTPVVASMGPGDFTLHGHFIVITGYEDGEFIVNDPFSVVNSETRWSYDKIESQIKNLWAIWLAEVETEEN